MSSKVQTFTAWKGSHFDKIAQFYARHSGSIGCLWILRRNEPQKYQQIVINAVTWSIFILAWLPTLIDIYQTPTIETLAVSINMFSSGMNDFTLWCVLVYYREEVRMLLEWCESTHKKHVVQRLNPIAQKIFKKCASDVVFYQRATLAGFMGILPLMFTPPILLYLSNGTVMLPFPNHWPFISNNHFVTYAINYMIQLIGVYTAATMAVTVNSLLFVSLFHVQYQLDFIEKGLKLIINDPAVTAEEFDYVIKYLIELHVKVVNVITTVNKVFTALILGVDGLNYFLIAFTFLLFELKNREVITFGFIALLEAGQLLLFSYLGTTFHEKSLDLATEIYMTNWYELSIPQQRYLQMMMIKAQNSVPIKAAGFTDLTLESFVDVMKRSYSFCAVVKVMVFT